MSIEQMREKVAGAYFGPDWDARVRKMSDAQIAAVYQRLLSAKKI